MRSVLVLSDSDLGRDSRVRRQIVALSDAYKVSVVGRGRLDMAKVAFHRTERDPADRIESPLLRGIARIINGALFFRAAARILRMVTGEARKMRRRAFLLMRFQDAVLRVAGGKAFDLVLANDFTALAAGVAAKQACSPPARLLFDAHEYSPGQFDGSMPGSQSRKEKIERVLRESFPACDGVTTVCGGIAEMYSAEFGIPGPTVIVNACPYESRLQPGPVDGSMIRLVHHGLAVRRRSLETMIEAAGLLGEGYSLDLFLVPSSRDYYDELVARYARFSTVHFRQPVRVDDIPETLNAYDIGVYCLYPANQNQEMALPNKLFEFIQARLAIAIGPSPEMRKVVEAHGLGVVSRDFSVGSFAEAIRSLSREDIATCKRHAHESARELSFERQADILRATVAGLIGE